MIAFTLVAIVILAAVIVAGVAVAVETDQRKVPARNAEVKCDALATAIDDRVNYTWL